MLTTTAAAIYQNYIDTRDYKLMYLNNFANVMFVTTTITLPAAPGGVCRTAHAAAAAAAAAAAERQDELSKSCNNASSNTYHEVEQGNDMNTCTAM